MSKIDFLFLTSFDVLIIPEYSAGKPHLKIRVIIQVMTNMMVSMMVVAKANWRKTIVYDSQNSGGALKGSRIPGLTKSMKEQNFNFKCLSFHNVASSHPCKTIF